MSQIDFNELVKQTVVLIIKKKLNSLDLKQSSYKEFSCWGQITLSLFKKFDPLLSLQIWKNWKYNIKDYQNAVRGELNKRGVTSFDYNGKSSRKL
jgi:hypothetical protein